MVKGRHARAQIARDCYSPKRHDTLDTLTLDNLVMAVHPHNNNNKRITADDSSTTTLTTFLQENAVELPKEDCIYDVDNDVVMTAPPAMITKEVSTTPHRIVCPDETTRPSLNPPQLSYEPTQPPKSRKRLNLDQKTGTNNTKSINNNTKSINDNHKLTEYFPVRRSVRKTKKTVLEEKQRDLERCVREGREEGLEVKVYANKGRGVVASRAFAKGDYVVEYSGDLIDMNEAKEREMGYAQDQNAGCYMYYFKHNDQQYCVDATAESGKLGRLVNHSRNGNLITRTILVDKKPRLVLLAKDDIKAGEELTYDYGDRSKESLLHHPWLAY